MSRYIELAHNSYVEIKNSTVPAGRKRATSQRVRPTLRPELRSVHDIRLANIRNNILRHESDLAEASTSPASGGRSAGLLLQLTRRLYQARQELADLCNDAVAPAELPLSARKSIAKAAPAA